MVSVDSNNLQVDIRNGTPPVAASRRRNFMFPFRCLRRNNQRSNHHHNINSNNNTRGAAAVTGPPPRSAPRPNAVSPVPNDITFGDTLPPSMIQVGGTNNGNIDNSPSTAYRQEVATNPRQHVSSDKPEHTFWLNRNLEPALSLIEADHAGRILYSTGNTAFVEESLGQATVIPGFISMQLPVYTEDECRTIFQQICETVLKLHQQHVVHRTLHLNHIAVTHEGHVLLRGFQHAVLLEQDKKTGLWSTTTPVAHSRRWDWYAFRAPELDRDERHGTSADVWSLGACLSMLLTGLPPFRGTGRDLKKKKQKAETAPYDIVVPSEGAQDLVRKMICPNPEERLTLKQVLDHEWMRRGVDEDDDNEPAVDLSLAQVFLQDWNHKSQ